MVVDNTSKPVNVISQSNVIQFLASHVSLLTGKVMQATVEDIGFIGKSVHTISQESRAIHAFFQMKTSKISALAVVNKQGVIQANISISDLRV